MILNREVLRLGNFVFLQDWPPEIISAVQSALEPCTWLRPAWCHDVCVTWNPRISDCTASMESDFRYRRACLRICAQFMDQTEAERINVLRHELLHISTSPIVDYATETFKRLLQEDEQKQFLKSIKDTLDERHEGCVEDLMRCIEAASISAKRD